MIPETPRARLLRVQAEVNSLFTDIEESGVTGINVAMVLAYLRSLKEVIEATITRAGRI